LSITDSKTVITQLDEGDPVDLNQALRRVQLVASLQKKLEGGYSFPLPGRFLHQARILRQGFGRLHFAGEHASNGFMGFMEGGLHSGLSAARRLAERDNIAIVGD
jgi:monoamine oxidase